MNSKKQRCAGIFALMAFENRYFGRHRCIKTSELIMTTQAYIL